MTNYYNHLLSFAELEVGDKFYHGGDSFLKVSPVESVNIKTGQSIYVLEEFSHSVLIEKKIEKEYTH